jgi:hypothetical protein
MSRKIISIGLNFWQTELVKAAVDLGFEVIGVDQNSNAPGVATCTEFFEMSAHNADGIAVALKARGIPNDDIAAVMTIGSRGSITCASRLASHLQTRGAVIDEERAGLLVDRGAFRAFLENMGLPCPAFALVEDVDTPVDFDGPWIVKSALDSSGSEGLTVVEDRAALPDAIEHALAVGRKRGVASPAIVETYIKGCDVGVLGLFRGGELMFQGIVERVVTPMPHCLPLHYSAPAELSEALRSSALEAYDRLCENLDVADGPIYAEIRLCERTGKAFILEAEPTLPAYAARVVAEAYGINLEDAFVRVITGGDLPAIADPHAASCHFVYGESGRFHAMHDAGIGGTVLQVRRPGDRINATDCSSIGAVCFARAATPRDARRHAAKRANYITISVDAAG